MRFPGTDGGQSPVTVRSQGARGQVIGYAAVDDHREHSALFWQDGQLSALGPGTVAAAINNRGQVLASTVNPTNGTTRGFLWQAGLITDVGADLRLSSPLQAKLNNRGQILVGLSVWQDGVLTS